MGVERGARGHHVLRLAKDFLCLLLRARRGVHLRARLVITDEEGAIEVLTSPADFEAVKNALEAAGLVADMAEVTMRAENSIALSGEDAVRMQKLLDVLEDLDDVQNVFHNAEFED